MRNPNRVFTVGLRDASLEPATFRLPIRADALAGDLTVLRAAVNNMSTLTSIYTLDGTENVLTTQTVGAGRREAKYLIRGYDLTTKEMLSWSLAGVRAATVYLGDTDFVDLVNDAIAAALVTAIEATGRNERSDNALNVTSIEVRRGGK